MLLSLFVKIRFQYLALVFFPKIANRSGKFKKQIESHMKQNIRRGIPTEQNSHTAENENSVPFSRKSLYAAVWLAKISNRIEFNMMKTRVRFCRK